MVIFPPSTITGTLRWPPLYSSIFAIQAGLLLTSKYSIEASLPSNASRAAVV
jgi:hypothetical protein